VKAPARPELNLDWVTPRLAVGGSFPLDAAEHLARVLGISRVVDLRIETCDDARVLREAGIELLHLPTEDQCGVSLAHLDAGVAWVTGELSAGRSVLVHCEHGIGRSALLACCVLVELGDPPLQALARAKAGRKVVSPSPAQLEAFRAWLAHRAQGAPDDLPSFDALAWIAYSHLRAPAAGE
jgi:hypothetical protein